VCPNIFFLGFSGVVRFGDLRIAGLSGIWKSGDYRRPYTAGPPYNHPGDIRSAYHIREFDVFKLSQLRQPLDVFISHDWPQGVASFGDMEQLFRAKPFLRQEVLDGSLGSQPGAQLLAQLAPDYWFSAHLHVRFPALIPRSGSRAGHTRFLALDKCLPGRNFLQVVDIPDRSAGPITWDEEWLAIVKATHHAMPVRHHPPPLPRVPPGGASVAEPHIAAVRDALQRASSSVVGATAAFTPTVQAHDPRQARSRRGAPPSHTPRNPQTLALLDLLQLEYVLDGQAHMLPPPPPLPQQPTAAVPNAEEVDLPIDGEEDATTGGGGGAGELLELPDEDELE